MITKNFNLDIIPGGSAPMIRLSQYDQDFTIILELFARRGEFIIESGTTAVLRGTKPNGDAYEAPVLLSGNIATIHGDGKLTDTEGTGVFELCLTHSRKELYTSNFTIVIEEAPTERRGGN